MINNFFSSQALLSFGLLIGLLNSARAGLSGCDDLGDISELPKVSFESEVQPIFDDNCIQCHGGPEPIAFMDLEQGTAELVGVPSFQFPSLDRVIPGDSSLSYLFIKINCASQLSGDRMPREAPPLSIFEQALIRDWIKQILVYQNGFE